MVIKDFTNTNFVILSYLYDEKDQNNIIKITQDEVAEHLGISRVTVNRAFVLFINNGYLKRDTSHVGRYTITTFGCKVVCKIRELNVEFSIRSANNAFNTDNIC